MQPVDGRVPDVGEASGPLGERQLVPVILQPAQQTTAVTQHGDLSGSLPSVLCPVFTRHPPDILPLTIHDTENVRDEEEARINKFHVS